MTVETPAVVLDMAKIRRNIEDMQRMADVKGFKLRPHIKTHKLPELALLQLAQGAVGITCATLGEAECMAANGVKDIFLAYPVIGPTKLERLLDLTAKIRLIASVDSREGALALSDAAVKRGITVEVRLEIDAGMHRAGVPYAEAVPMAGFINGLPNVNFTGIYTFKSNIYKETPTADNKSAAAEENAVMAETAKLIREAGIPIADVSGGSTPTAAFAGDSPGLTEIRPGTYIFGDAMRLKTGAVEPERCAAVVEVTVISVPTKTRAVIDGGSKTFAGDISPNQPPLFLKGYGHIIGRDDLTIVRLSEEHGVIEAAGGIGLTVGDRLRVIPNHICTAINLQEYVYIHDEDGGVRKVKIEARAR